VAHVLQIIPTRKKKEKKGDCNFFYKLIWQGSVFFYYFHSAILTSSNIDSTKFIANVPFHCNLQVKQYL